MAHPQSAPGGVQAKMSFAKIAAMPPPMPPQLQGPLQKDPKPETQQGANQAAKHPRRETVIQFGHVIPEVTDADRQVMSTANAMQSLNLSSPTNGVHTSQNGESNESLEEDRSEVSSDSVNKPNSFDTKSMASVTTFAMDDKESIRPDDSASVRAADEDNAQPVLSRNSSFQHEVDTQANRPVRFPTTNGASTTRRYPTLANPPRFGNMPMAPLVPDTDPAVIRPAARVLHPDDPREPIQVLNITPDDKLLEALASIKERLPLLQLEERVLAFIQTTTNECLELPPQNAFSRLLTHKLADYYNLAHTFNEDNGSVRIHRTGLRSFPTPLAQIAQSITTSNGNGATTTTVKIMRREQMLSRGMSGGNSTAASSSAPSKATSENGVDGLSDEGLQSPSEGTPNRKLTREQREAQYKIVRERIFGDFQEGIANEQSSTGDNSASMSRSSSSSGKKKSKKHKQPKDDSFDSRSAFVASFAPMHMQYPSQSDPYGVEYQAHNVQPGNGLYGVTPTQAYPGFGMNSPLSPSHNYAINPNEISQYQGQEWQQVQQMQQNYFMYPDPNAYMMQSGMTSPTQMMPMQQNNPMGAYPGWYNGAQPSFNNVQNGQMQSMPVANFDPGMTRNSQSSYGYGRGAPQMYGQQTQYPNHNNTTSARSLFNPQTRSFVPNTNNGRGANRGARKKNSGRPGEPNNIGARTDTNTSGYSTREDSLQQKYGTPASLPKKPPVAEGKAILDNSNGQQTAAITVVDGPLVDPLPVHGTGGHYE